VHNRRHKGRVGDVVAAAPAVAAPTQHLTVLHVGQIAQQDIPPESYSEPDTLVEPDVAVSPANPDWAVAVAHDGRYPDGGAVDITYAWTHDGGKATTAVRPGITSRCRALPSRRVARGTVPPTRSWRGARTAACTCRSCP
jgi:hypothetical protein